jgi:hypothetical protein
VIISTLLADRKWGFCLLGNYSAKDNDYLTPKNYFYPCFTNEFGFDQTRGVFKARRKKNNNALRRHCE